MKSFRSILSEYILNEYARQESGIKQAERNIRFGEYNSYDVAELQLLKCRFEGFKECANNVMILCKVSEDNIVDYYNKYLEGENNVKEKRT